MYPEHEKLRAVKDRSQVIGGFLEWLEDNGYSICDIDDTPINKSINVWLADYFKIDLKKLAEEKDQMVEVIYGQH